MTAVPILAYIYANPGSDLAGGAAVIAIVAVCFAVHLYRKCRFLCTMKNHV